MEGIFVDTDICIDLLSGRKPYNAVAERLFSLADLGEINLCVSSLSFSHIDYILKSHYKRIDSRLILAKFKTLVLVLDVNERVIDLAIASDFDDFEDAIQYNTAIENNLKIILTRNLKDYKKSIIQVMNSKLFYPDFDWHSIIPELVKVRNSVLEAGSFLVNFGMA